MEKEFDFGARLRHIRELRRLTQSEVANLIGTNLRNYQYYEYGKHRLPTATLYTILYALDISADYYFGFVSDPLSHKAACSKQPESSSEAGNVNIINKLAKVRMDILGILHDLDHMPISKSGRDNS